MYRRAFMLETAINAEISDMEDQFGSDMNKLADMMEAELAMDPHALKFDPPGDPLFWRAVVAEMRRRAQ
jgi:hypothetical protein